MGRVLYVSGEESEEQIKMRADRVCGEIDDNLFILAETNMENINGCVRGLLSRNLVIIRFHSDHVYGRYRFRPQAVYLR